MRSTLTFGSLALAAVSAVFGCEREAALAEREVVTRVEALTSLAPRPPSGAAPEATAEAVAAPSAVTLRAVTVTPRSVPARSVAPRAVPLRAAMPPSALPEHASSACPDVERQARELGRALPRQLDADTRATRVTSDGCDLRVEYELSTLSARDVSERGLRAMRGAVLERLCSDKGALAVMQRGGRFTNVYTDRAQAPIALFTVAADDCGI